MRSLVHRRHSLRDPGGAHLSAEGVARARAVGRTSGTFDRVVTSTKPRARETAHAMGYDVDAELEELGSLSDPVARFLDRVSPASFAEYLGCVSRVDEVRAEGEALAARWAMELEKVPEGGRLLMVSHAGLIELGAVTAAGGTTAEWGRPLAPLEGVRLDRGSGAWTHAEVVRLGEHPGSADGGPDPGPHGGRIARRVDRSEDPVRPIVL
jgi:broad specificity phosphatase PhoE